MDADESGDIDISLVGTSLVPIVVTAPGVGSKCAGGVLLVLGGGQELCLSRLGVTKAYTGGSCNTPSSSLGGGPWVYSLGRLSGWSSSWSEDMVDVPVPGFTSHFYRIL